MQGEEDFYGFISVAKPYGKTGHQTWHYQWLTWCQTETPIATPTAPVSCTGPTKITGLVKNTYTNSSLGRNCTAKITSLKGAEWTIGLNPRSRTTVLLHAGPPDADAVTVPSPPGSTCRGFDQAIRWKKGPETLAPVTWDFPDHRRPAFGSGEYVDYAHGAVVRGHVTSNSVADFKFHSTN
jgi:hypothetical protein